jgi:hypothetical protein
MSITNLEFQEMRRRTMPKQLRAQAEAAAAASDKYEREGEMHSTFADLLYHAGWPFIHARFGKIVRDLPPGHPDFTILFGGKCPMVEFKTEDGELTESQKARIPVLIAAKNDVLVTSSVVEAFRWTKRILEGGE